MAERSAEVSRRFPWAAICAALGVSLATLAMTWRALPHAREQSDADHYITMAEGRPAEVIKPFANRILQPAAVRALATVTGMDIHQSFFIWGVVTLAALTLAVALMLDKTGSPHPAILTAAVLFNPCLLDMFTSYYLNGLFHAAVLACFLLLAAGAEARPRRQWLVATVLLIACLVRESTLLLAVCTAPLAFYKKCRTLALGVVAAAVVGMLVVGYATRQSKPNIHGLGTLSYMMLKFPFNFSKNYLGFPPWSNTHAANAPGYPPPIFTVAVPHWLHWGNVKRVGMCAFAPRYPLNTYTTFLTLFGIAPAVLLAIARRRFSLLTWAPLWIGIAMTYGVSVALIGPLTAAGMLRIIGYGWPAFWIAAPWLLFQLHPSEKECRYLLLCHILACWTPWLLGMMHCPEFFFFALVLVIAAVLQWLSYRLVRQLSETALLPGGA